MDFISKIIEASAGTGKTHMLTEEFIHRLEKSSSIDSLKHFLALTFSEEAACEMKERIVGRIWDKLIPGIKDEAEIIKLENNLFRIRISTIHSFCRSILKRFSFVSGIDPLFTVTDENTGSILFERAKYKFLKNVSESDADFSFLCKRLKLNDLLKFINGLQELHPHVFLGVPGDFPLTSMIYKYFLSIRKIYEGLKKEKAFLDFNDLETKTYSIIRENPEALNVLYDFDESIDIVFVDEFQDTNLLQWEIIKEFTLDWISGYGSKADTGRPYGVFIVGDKKQSIYYFRGAEKELMAEAETFFSRSLQKEFLTQSFRSFPGIVDFVNEAFKNFIPVEERLKVRNEFRDKEFQDRSFVEINIFEKNDKKINLRKRDEYAWVAKRIKKILFERFQVWDKSQKKFRDARYSDIAILFRKRSHLTILEEVLRSFGIPYVNIGGIGFYQEPEILFMLSLVFVLIDPSDVFSFWHLKNSLFKIDEGFISKYRNNLSREPIVNIIENILDELNFRKNISTQKQANIEKFLIVLNSLQKFPLFQAGMSLRHLMKNSNEPKADVFTEDENAVRVLTVHSSKGLEFPVVFIIDAEQGRVDKRNISILYNKFMTGMEAGPEYVFGLKMESEKELSGEFYKRLEEEETNLLYVALTRARQGIIVVGDNIKDKKNTVWLKILEPFFSECVPEVGGEKEIFPACSPVEEKEIKRHLPEIRSFIPVSWTSISSGNKNVPDFAEKHDEEVFGIIIHKILSEIGRNKVSADFDRLKKRAEFYFNKFSVVPDEKLLNIHINNIVSEKLKDVVCPVHDGFNELNFLFSMDNQVFQGYIDRLIVRENVVYVYDFKTRKSLKITEDDKKQIYIYRKAVEGLFPGRKYKNFLVFTFYGIIKPINTGGENERGNSPGL
ncbi:MAG: UvrD-helicase domain-containing protein [Candidatus Omnitrophica bacterium]|nr:UvrD-helicase domain-containing protein [Candidatus Omnitrophota bacterium]